MAQHYSLYLYLDDVREFDKESTIPKCINYYVSVKSVSEAISVVNDYIDFGVDEIWFDLDHDLGEYADDGGDAIKLIDWLVENFHDDNSVTFKFHFHSMNPVGVENMRNAVEKYWEVF